MLALLEEVRCVLCETKLDQRDGYISLTESLMQPPCTPTKLFLTPVPMPPCTLCQHFLTPLPALLHLPTLGL